MGSKSLPRIQTLLRWNEHGHGGDTGGVGAEGALVPVESSLVVSEDGRLPGDLIASESTTNPGNARGVTGLGRSGKQRDSVSERFGIKGPTAARAVVRLARDPIEPGRAVDAIRVTLPRRGGHAAEATRTRPRHLGVGIRSIHRAPAREAAYAIRVTEPTPHITPLAPPQDLGGK